MRKYEALFILSNTISDEQLESRIEQISSEIVKLGGTVQAATRMGRITFARPIAKKEVGVYVQLVFMMEPDKIKAMHDHYRHNEDLIRLQIMSAKSSPAGNAERSAVGRPAGTPAAAPAKKSAAAGPGAKGPKTAAK